MPLAERLPKTILGMAAGALLLGLSCHSQADRILVTASDNGRTVAAQVGDKIEVALDTIGPFPFGTPIVSSTSVRFLGESDKFPSPSLPSGAETQQYTFAAEAAGRAEITIPRLPVAGPPPFAITVQVY